MYGWLSFVFHAISASTTTGFQFLIVELSDGGKILLIILMLVGGTAFSTAGGIKITRFLYIFKKMGQKTNLLSYQIQIVKIFQHLFHQLLHNSEKVLKNIILISQINLQDRGYHYYQIKPLKKP